MNCPICKSDNLRIRRSDGFSQTLIKECSVCETVFLTEPNKKPNIIYVKNR